MLSDKLQKEVDDILESYSVHYFTKEIIKEGLQKDCVDAYYDVKLALDILKKRMDEVLR